MPDIEIFCKDSARGLRQEDFPLLRSAAGSMGRKLLVAWIASVLLLRAAAVNACTLWAAAGDEWVKGGGTLIVKNRDVQPNHWQELRLIKPSSGHPYLGLFAVGGDMPGLKAGINECGLVVVTAVASSIPSKERSAMKSAKGVSRRLLADCDSVDAALKKTDLFLGPQYLMLADKNKIAYVEIGPEGKFATKTVDKGVLYHTNHYVEDKLLWANKKIPTGSQVRYDRIKELLGETARPFGMKEFIAFSQDRAAGPDNSIWRTGSKPELPRTLATWIVALPPIGSPKLYVKLANPGEEEKLIEENVSDVFAGQAKSHITTHNEPMKQADVPQTLKR